MITSSAIADGVTDITAVLQCEILAAAGIALYFPAGDYKFSTLSIIK